VIDPLWIVRTVAEAALLPWVAILVVVLIAFVIGWVQWNKRKELDRSARD